MVAGVAGGVKVAHADQSISSIAHEHIVDALTIGLAFFLYIPVNEQSAAAAGLRHYIFTKVIGCDADEKGEHQQRGQRTIERDSGGGHGDDLILPRHVADAEQTGQQHGDRKSQKDDVGQIIDIQFEHDQPRHFFTDVDVQPFDRVHDQKNADKGDEREKQDKTETAQDVPVQHSHAGLRIHRLNSLLNRTLKMEVAS
ncbi:MAG: hypothetical protein BWY83_02043 [bacterium ADurb.Bin478]|nr:MAG: hypothetical protein BWY83_02043 [bacterium ADurb.Bin478]